MSSAWSRPRPEKVVRRIAADRPIYFISDMHLGDGGATDIFVGKDRALQALLARVREEGARLVILGDAIDFIQAWGMTRVLRAHGPILRAISDLSDTNGVIYVYGNHDHDISLYRDILRWDVASELWIGPDVAVQHGHVFDPMIGGNLRGSELSTHVHHLIEKLIGQFIRIPLGEFYNPANRLCFWIAHKAWLLAKIPNTALRAVGLAEVARRVEESANYWIRNESGDPMSMFRPAVAWAKQAGAHTVVCGHAHMPGNIVHDGVRYVNTGSWTWGWSQYAYWDGQGFTVRDWLSGREYGDELYRPLADGELDHVDVDRWWRNQYLGWFRFRTGELRRQRAIAAP